MNRKQDELLNSNYDGIQEYDNDLPRWWQALFVITILFGIGYVFHFHVSSQLDSQARLDGEMAALTANIAPAPSPQTDAATLLAYAKDPGHLVSGKNTFVGKCAPCHGAEGQGIVGPNLADKYWLHGGSIADIRKTIEVGVPEKGMLSWKPILSSQEIDDVAAYIFSLKGTNPENPKAPQGDPFTE